MMLELARNMYVSKKDGKALGSITPIEGVNTVFTTSNDTFITINFSYENGESLKEYKIPSGDRVTDSIGMIQNVASAIEVANKMSLMNKRDAFVKKIDSLESTNSYSASKHADLNEGLRYYKTAITYFNSINDYSYDYTAMLIAFSMKVVGSGIKKERAEKLVTAIKESKDSCNLILSNLINAKECTYIKNTRCALNDSEYANILHLVASVTRKWNARGIQAVSMKDADIIRQVLLTVFESEYNLHVIDKPKTTQLGLYI